MSKQRTNDEEIVTISQEIKKYLMAHPNAADSLEGIAKWWLTRQRYEQAVVQVEKSLDQLVVEGVVSKYLIADGKVVYTSAKRDISSKGKSV